MLFLTQRGGDDGASVAEGAELEHVHGLGVDPADGTLYAGSHYGLFRLPERGQTVRVADRVQDFMGFTIAGPDHFLASGHPGAGEGGPSSLGLIESTDGGQTWHSLSLAGQADFHTLEARHGRVYGFASFDEFAHCSVDRVRGLLVQPSRQSRASGHPCTGGVAVTKQHGVQAYRTVADISVQQPLGNIANRSSTTSWASDSAASAMMLSDGRERLPR